MLKRKKKEKHYTYPVRDVSHYIIVYSNKKDYGVSNLKLQKLLYFVQAFFLINDCPPCFDEKIEAWDFGPVVPEIYREYKRYGGIDIPTIDYYVKFDKKNIWNTERIYYEDIISDDDKEMIQAVVDKFAHCSATFLVNLTHNQDPWINAYVNGQRNEITKEDIKRYFEQKKGELHMGLTENQKNMIRCLANKDIKNTREWAKVVLMDDSTQKN